MFNLSYCFKTTVLCAAVLIGATLPAQEEKARMAVAIESSDPSLAPLARRVSDKLVVELRKNKNYQFTEFSGTNAARARMEKTLDYVVSGSIRAYRDADIGGTVVTTVVNKLGFSKKPSPPPVKVVIDVEVRNVKTGANVLSETREAKDSRVWAIDQKPTINDYLRIAEEPIRMIASVIMREILPAYPTVLRVRGGELTLGMGSHEGVKIDQKLQVIREGDVLRDQYGDFVSVETIIIAEIRITRVEPKIAYAEIVEKINDEVNVGDMVRPSEKEDSLLKRMKR